MTRRSGVIVGVGAAALLAACGATTGGTSAGAASPSGSTVPHVFEAEHFASGAIVKGITTQDCTLSGGAKATCASVTIAGYPASYRVGPFCPTTITTPAADAGIWFDGNGLYDLTGSFVKNLAAFYNDPAWKMYDSAGTVNVTGSKDAFNGAARPDVDPAYHNYCVEGRLEWLPNGKPIETTMLIPTMPVRAQSASSDHPGNLGITLDGVVIAESAPVQAILGAHTIAAFDDCGGHFNPVEGYHLHGVTGCGTLDSDGLVDGETAMFGYAADGYPIHLPLEGAALTTAGLDQCNGHSTEGQGYHYHANGPAKNAVLPCLMGEYVSTGRPGAPGPPQGAGPATGGQAGAGPAGGGQSLTVIAAKLGVTVHEVQDAMATGDVKAAAQMLGTTPEAMAKKLGVSVADLQAAIAPRGGATPSGSN